MTQIIDKESCHRNIKKVDRKRSIPMLKNLRYNKKKAMDIAPLSLEDLILRASYLTLEDKLKLLEKLPALGEGKQAELRKVFLQTEQHLGVVEEQNKKLWDFYLNGLREVLTLAKTNG